MDDRSGPMMALNIFFMIFCIVIVGLRVYCRGWVIRNFGMDDWLMLVAWACLPTTHTPSPYSG